MGVEKRSCSALCFPSALSLSRETIELERVPSSNPPSPRWRPVSVENRNDGDLEAAISPSLFFIAPLRKKSQTGTYRRRGVLSCPALGDCNSSITAFVDFSSPLMEEGDAMMAKKCAPHGHADFVRRSKRRIDGELATPLVLWQRGIYLEGAPNCSLARDVEGVSCLWISSARRVSAGDAQVCPHDGRSEPPGSFALSLAASCPSRPSEEKKKKQATGGRHQPPRSPFFSFANSPLLLLQPLNLSRPLSQILEIKQTSRPGTRRSASTGGSWPRPSPSAPGSSPPAARPRDSGPGCSRTFSTGRSPPPRAARSASSSGSCQPSPPRPSSSRWASC